MSNDPPLVAVALAYDGAGTWSWSHGEQQQRVGVEFWNNGYIEEASTGILLQYGAVTGGSPELASVIDTYIVLPDEDFDPQLRRVVEWESESMNEHQLSETPEGFDETGDALLPGFLE